MGRQYGFNSFEIDSAGFKRKLTPEELRLGNYIETFAVVYDGKGNYTAPGISKTKVSLKDLELLQLPFATYRPIPLTPEILEKAGFTKHKNSNEFWSHWVLKNNWLVSEWVHDYPVSGFEEKGVCYWSEEYVPVDSLHKLQNLYFALTGKELEINL